MLNLCVVQPASLTPSATRSLAGNLGFLCSHLHDVARSSAWDLFPALFFPGISQVLCFTSLFSWTQCLFCLALHLFHVLLLKTVSSVLLEQFGSPYISTSAWNWTSFLHCWLNWDVIYQDHGGCHFCPQSCPHIAFYLWELMSTSVCYTELIHLTNTINFALEPHNCVKKPSNSQK